MEDKDRLFVALDTSREEASRFVTLLNDEVGGFKLGLVFGQTMHSDLLTSVGHVDACHKLGKYRDLFRRIGPRLFWDGKFADTPSSVGRASQKVFAEFFTVHASAGRAAMMAAVERKPKRSNVLAVTVLTSLSEADVVPIFGAPSKEKVLQFAREALQAGCDGIVCSPLELEIFAQHPELNSLLKVSPGIRGNKLNDGQERTMTAYEAIKAGADYVVVGRPITNSLDPVATARGIVSEIARAMSERNAA